MDRDLRMRLTCGCLIELNLNVVVSLRGKAECEILLY